jgi:hypothetical protein
MPRTTLCAAALLAVLATTPQVRVGGSGRQAFVAVPTSAECSLTWVGREDEIEVFLASGRVLKMEDVPIGVTKPQRATLEPGPVARFAWKPIKPGYSKGFMESYRAEIAAYKLDRMLDLHMVPPIVEREFNGRNGAAVMWIENTRGWNLKQPPQGPQPTWSRQITRMKMFDLLIANIDRNEGNLIYDADWHLFLIDHSRAFTNKKDLKGLEPLGRVDRQLWDKMAALGVPDLEAGLGTWVSTDDLKALLIRRDRMATVIKDMVAKRGETGVFYD